MTLPGGETLLVRYGEIGIKSASVQAGMEQQLAQNIRATLTNRGIQAQVEREHTRLYVRDADDTETATEAVTDVFGVVSVSPAITTRPTLDAMCKTLADAATAHPSGSFAVRATRAGQPERHPFTSLDIEREGGSAVAQALNTTGVEPTVDLENPSQTYYVECRPEEAFVFLEKRDGPGGLPVGTQEPLVALVSGGIDSPVAAWLAMKRGCPVYPLYVDLGDFGGSDHRARAISTASHLSRFAGEYGQPVLVAPGGEALTQIMADTDDCRMPVIRRFLYRVAEQVATDVGAVGIVTGEAIGQKSSQTSANLRATSAVTPLPVHRPLLSMDKPEITQLARSIGTYETATVNAGCYRLAPENPVTAPTVEAVERAEPADIAELAAKTAQLVERVGEGTNA